MLSGERHGNQHLHLRQLILPSYRGKEPESEPQGHQWTPGSYHTHTSTFTWCQYADVWFLGLWGHWGPYSPISCTTTYLLFHADGLLFLFFSSQVSHQYISILSHDGEHLSTEHNTCSVNVSFISSNEKVRGELYLRCTETWLGPKPDCFLLCFNYL